MSSPKRKRDLPVLFWVSADEMELIQQKMAQFGTKNLSAYLRKMAVDGYVVQLDLPELKELVSLLRRSSNNLNQLTRKVHETGRVYNADSVSYTHLGLPDLGRPSQHWSWHRKAPATGQEQGFPSSLTCQS